MLTVVVVFHPICRAADGDPMVTGAGMKSDGKNGVPAEGMVLKDGPGMRLLRRRYRAVRLMCWGRPPRAYFKAPDDYRNNSVSAPHPVIMTLMFRDNMPGEYHLYYDSTDSKGYKGGPNAGCVEASAGFENDRGRGLENGAVAH